MRIYIYYTYASDDWAHFYGKLGYKDGISFVYLPKN